jgi:hypothetical protein
VRGQRHAPAAPYPRERHIVQEADDLYTFVISLSVLLRMKNVSDKNYTEQQNTRFVFYNFFYPENRVLCEIMCTKQGMEPDRS